MSHLAEGHAAQHGVLTGHVEVADGGDDVQLLQHGGVREALGGHVDAHGGASLGGQPVLDGLRGAQVRHLHLATRLLNRGSERKRRHKKDKIKMYRP